MKAVKAELKAGQRIILDQLMQSACGRPFLEAKNTSIIDQDKTTEIAVQKEFRTKSEIVDVEELRLKFPPEEEEKFAADPIEEDRRLREAHGLRSECRVAVPRMRVPSLALEQTNHRLRKLEEEESPPEIKELEVLVRDLKGHSWWGPRIKEYLANR